MKILYSILLITNWSFLIVNAQTQFQRTFGGTGGDYCSSIIQTTDAGYIVAGYTNSFGAGGNDFYIVKLGAAGTLQWTRTLGGTGNDIALSIIQTTDGGYAVSGETTSFGAGNFDAYIMKLDAGGSLEWSRTIGGTGYDYALSIAQTTDGGYALFGSATSFGAGYNDFYIVKLDSSGLLQWNRTIGSTGGDYGFSVIQTTDGGYALSGTTASFGAEDLDLYIVKLDGSGSLQWTKTIGGTDHDYGYNIIQTADGGYALSASTASFGAGSYDAYIVKLDSSGTLQWSRTAGGVNNDYALSIIQTTDGGYVAAGYTASFGAGDFDICIVKLDAGGITCGNTSLASPTTGTGGILGSPTSLTTSPTPSVSSSSLITGTGGTLTTLCVIGIQPISNKLPGAYELCQNYPNPFNPMTKIKFSIPLTPQSPLEGGQTGVNVSLIIYDALGREVAVFVNEQLKPGSYEVEWSATGGASNYPSGVYFYKLTAGDFSDTKKMVLIK